jgi:quinol monooxygenase YgiN
MSDLHVVAIITAKPGSEDEVKAALEVLAAASREEPGNITYFLHVSAADPAVFVTVESWKSQADLESHMQTEHLKSASTTFADKLAGPPAVHPLVPIS